METVVWLDEYRRFGVLLKMDAYTSTVVMWDDNGNPQQVLVENDDYDLWEERAIEYESDEWD